MPETNGDEERTNELPKNNTSSIAATSNQNAANQNVANDIDSNEVESIWSETIRDLQLSLDPQVFKAYVQPLNFISFEQGGGELNGHLDGAEEEIIAKDAELHLAAPSRLISQHVSTHFSADLTKLFSSSVGVSTSLKISIGKTPAQKTDMPKPSSSKYVVVKKIRNRGDQNTSRTGKTTKRWWHHVTLHFL